MPGWEIWKKFWKYSKSKPKWLRQEKISKFQSQNHWVRKIKKYFLSSDWLRHFQTFSKYFQFNIEVNGISMYMQGIWERKGLKAKLSFTNKVHKAQKCYNSNSTKFYLQVQVQLIQDGWHDLWHMKTCDFLWKYQMFKVPMKKQVRAKNLILSSFAVHIWAHWGSNTKFSIDFALEPEMFEISRYKFC